jgi:hypothetical protein
VPKLSIEAHNALITAVNAVAAYEDDESDLPWEGVSRLVREAIDLVGRDRDRELERSSAGFDGATYNPALDLQRLERQMGRVFEHLSDGQWHTLSSVRDFAGGSENGVAARIRDLRKAKFGSWIVDRERDTNRKGLHHYRLRNHDGTEMPPICTIQPRRAVVPTDEGQD